MPTKSARAKSNGWKAIQSSANVKKRTKLALFALGLLIILIILGNLVSLAKNLFSPWKGISSEKNYLWDGQFNINILLQSKPLSVFSYNPQEEKITVVKIPDETYLEVPGGFGSWQVRSIYNLGQTSSLSGNKLLKDSLSSFLGIPIDGFLEPVGALELKTPEQLIEALKGSPFNVFSIITNIKTNLTLWELIHLKLALSKVRFDKVKIWDLDNLGVLEKENLADGSQVLVADPIRIDSILSDFQDPQIQKEHLSIAVFNATNFSLMGQKAARLIKNIGGNVIIIGNAPQRMEKTIVLGQSSASLQRLLQIFGCDNCDKIELKDFGIDSSRGQINLLLGEDFYSRL